jgi:hypothetical protein
MASHCRPRGVEMRRLSASAIARNVVAPVFWISAMIGSTFAARRSALALRAAAPASRAPDRFGLPSFWPRAFAAHRVPFVVAELGADADPFMLHLFAALAENELTLIPQRRPKRAQRKTNRKTGARG